MQNQKYGLKNEESLAAIQDTEDLHLLESLINLDDDLENDASANGENEQTHSLLNLDLLDCFEL